MLGLGVLRLVLGPRGLELGGLCVVWHGLGRGPVPAEPGALGLGVGSLSRLGVCLKGVCLGVLALGDRLCPDLELRLERVGRRWRHDAQAQEGLAQRLDERIEGERRSGLVEQRRLGLRRPVGVDDREDALDGGLRGDCDPDLVADRARQVGEQWRRGIRGGHEHDLPVEDRERHTAEVARQLAGEHQLGPALARGGVEIDEVEPALICKRLGERLFGDPATAKDDLTKPLAGHFLLVEGLGELLGVQEPSAQEQSPDAQTARIERQGGFHHARLIGTTGDSFNPVEGSVLRYRLAAGSSRAVTRARVVKASHATRTPNANTIAGPPGTRVTPCIPAPTIAAQGIVMIQAAAMFPATPQRTAEKRFVAPAPSTEPEIVCVVETGKPKCAVRIEDDARRRLRGEPLRRLELRDPLAEGADDAPAPGVRAGRDRAGGGDDHPDRRAVEVGAQVAGGDEREDDDAHRLLRVVRSVGECEEARRHELRPAKHVVDEPGRPAPDDPEEHDHEQRRSRHAEHGRGKRGDEHLLHQPAGDEHVEPVRRDRRAGDAADQRVARARREPQVPRCEVPADRADQAGEDDLEGDGGGVDDARRHGRGHLERHEGAGEVQDRCHDHGDARVPRARRDSRRDGVRRVVEAVREVEEERDPDDGDEQKGDVSHAATARLGAIDHQAFLTTILPITLATVSQASTASSRVS